MVNKQQADVLFSISRGGVLFPLEMGADVKAISVSGFTVMSLEPAKSRGQMSVLFLIPCSENIRELFPPLSSPPPAKKTQNITIGRTEYSLRSRDRRPVFGAGEGASEAGEKGSGSVGRSSRPGSSGHC